MRCLDRRLARPAVLTTVLWSLVAGPVLGDQGSVEVTPSATTRDGPRLIQSDKVLEVSTRAYPCGYPWDARLPWDADRLRVREIGLGGLPSPPLPSPSSPVGPRGVFDQTWIFVHGNHVSEAEAIRRGLLVYRNVRRHSSSGPVRFVIWSWPSQRKVGRIRDAQQKAIRTDLEALLLGNFLAQTAQTPGEVISLVGYSFGARIIAGAVQLAAGGPLAGGRLAALPHPSTRIRVSLMAAAVERDGFRRGGRYGQALERIEALMLMNNSRDLALRFFWVMEPRHKPTALGDLGLACIPRTIQVQQFDWAGAIGRQHSLMEYVCRPAIMDRVARHVVASGE